MQQNAMLIHIVDKLSQEKRLIIGRYASLYQCDNTAEYCGSLGAGERRPTIFAVV